MNKSYMTKHYWSVEEDNWIKEKFSYYKNRSTMLLKFNKTFNVNITINALTQRLLKYDLLPCNSCYTPEMEEWIKDNYRLDVKTAQEMTDEFNAHFGTNKTKSSIWHKAYRLTGQRVSDEPKTRLEYTPEMIERIKELVPKYSYNKVAQMMSTEFNYKFTPSMIEHKANRLGVKKPNNGYDNLDPRLPSINWFMKGRPSILAKPVGTESIMTYKNGRQYVHVKIAEPDIWEYKHRLVWKQHHGEIPEGHNIIWLDGNTLNCDIENLALVSRGEHGSLNRLHYRFNDAELTKTGLNVIRLMNIKNKRRKKNGN